MDMQQTLSPGTTVYGADGEKVGTVNTVGGQYIVIEKGFFFPKDYYVPVSAIAESTDDGVFLTVTKDEALNQGWDQDPGDLWTTGSTADTSGQYATTTGTERDYVEQEHLTVPVHEEHLQATKRMADAGEVTISKHVVTEQETIDVPVTEERVRVDWRAPSGETSAEGAVFEEGTIEVPVSREVVDVQKRVVQTGELEVTKEREQRTQRVTDSVRREVVDVEDESGDATRNTR